MKTITDTQAEGFATVSPKAPTMRARIHAMFQEWGPLTDPELVEHYRRQWGEAIYRSVGTRRRELVDAGVLKDSGQRKRNPATGVANIIWSTVQ